eukprot:scaffold138473_cov32-Tisochrysis_lutea.AAC.1
MATKPGCCMGCVAAVGSACAGSTGPGEWWCPWLNGHSRGGHVGDAASSSAKPASFTASTSFDWRV